MTGRGILTGIVVAFFLACCVLPIIATAVGMLGLPEAP